jgi:hypothetical protein
LRAAGWTFPENPAEVEQVEQEHAENPVELPEHLSDAAKVFNKIHLPQANINSKAVLPFPRNSDARSELARAAREGGKISKNLADRMHKDRRKAEDQVNE